MTPRTQRATHVSSWTQVKQFATALGPLKRAGILRNDGPKALKNMSQWGISMAALVENDCLNWPDRLAIVDDFGELTYSELRTQARTLAVRLMEKGITEGSTIAILARNSRAIVLPLLACSYLGARPMIMNPASSSKQVSAIMSDYGADILVVDAEYNQDAEFPIKSLTVGGDHDEFLSLVSGPTDSSKLPRKPRQQETIIMSSGTYGIPKGVRLPVPRTPKVLGGIVKAIPWKKNMVVQLTASVFHAWGWLNLQIGLATGATLILRRNFDADQAAADCLQYGVTGIVSAAVFLKDLVTAADRAETKIGPFEFIVSSGNAMPPYLVRELNKRFGPVVCNFYGSTEHGQIAIATGPEFAADPHTTGHIPSGVELRIFREDGTEANPGELGNVYAANSMTMIGLLAARDKYDVINGLLGTGDKGLIDQNGMLQLAGRADDMLIKGGENVYPREVEEFLGTVDGIDDVFVHGSQDDIVATLRAYVVREDSVAGANLSDDMIREHVRQNLAEHNVPDEIVWMKSLPRNDGGKVVPRRLPDTSV
ncbi:AMP-binding protein [Corynebacterium amycolatum]|uniref:AMP-binding protein n=1 Tax=Corynebacterium amycolatum TaxID=43765 RepID=UPI000185BEF1|nr:AMP-binding protein [Corynebacterium amycolatum]EEB63117.1 putative long-chain-fatty-acid--CoA ligase [Corynebacterium amycolatum SK46]